MTKYLPLTARVLLALLYLAGGAMGLLYALGLNPDSPGTPVAKQIADDLIAHSYLYHLLKVVELVGVVLLLVPRFVPLAVVLLAPATISITVLHVFHDPAGLPLNVLLLVLHAYLVYHCWPRLRGVLQAV